MISAFSKAFAAVIQVEGGLSLDPQDRGNWTSGVIGVGELRGTKYGVSAMSYPTLDIAGLSLAAARQIYFRDFWLPLHADAMPEAVAVQVFDAAVNHGIKAATRMMQRALQVDADGVLGPVTLTAMTTIDDARFAARFAAERLLYYTDLAGWESFGRGWTRRVAGNLRLA